ncbi:MAG TPA: hypothetical protein VJR05_07040 [Acidimicrobiia bacterium]|nr:hypothetical protein [Acidimicrobiia bacterium]
MRNLLLLLHIVGAAGWIGAGIFAQYVYTRITRGAPASAADSLAAIGQKASFYFGSVSGLVLLSGIALVLTSDAYGWTDTFVLIGIAAFVLSGIWQSLIGNRTDQRFLAAVKGDGTDPVIALKSWRRVSSVDLGILLVTVYAMIAKL